MATKITKKFFSGEVIGGEDGGVVELVCDINLGTYATGGPAVDFTTVDSRLANSKIIHFDQSYSKDLANYILWDSANNKIVAYVRSTDAEVANGVTLNDAATEWFRAKILFRLSTALDSTEITIDAA